MEAGRVGELEAGEVVAQAFWFAWEASDYAALERFATAGVVLVPDGRRVTSGRGYW